MAAKRLAPPRTCEQPLEPANKKQVVDVDHPIQEALNYILSQFKAPEQTKKFAIRKVDRTSTLVIRSEKRADF